MQKKFIYIFSADDKEKMLKAGYELCDYDKANNIWIFANSDTIDFSLQNNGIEYCYSSVMTF